MEIEIAELKLLMPEARKNQEAQFIKKYMRRGQKVYLVEFEWSDDYTKYFLHENREQIRPIDNSDLLHANGKLRSDIKSKIDYY